VELEQSAQKRLRVVARKVAALDQSDRVREIGERQPVREARSLGALRGGDEFARSSPAQAPATPQLIRSTHAAETTWRQSARRLRAEVETTQSARAQAVIGLLAGDTKSAWIATSTEPSFYVWASDEGPPVKEILRRESYTISRSRSWRSTTAKRNCTVRSDGVLTSPKEKPPELALPR
jgi:hypothetical protein